MEWATFLRLYGTRGPGMMVKTFIFRHDVDPGDKALVDQIFKMLEDLELALEKEVER